MFIVQQTGKSNKAHTRYYQAYSEQMMPVKFLPEVKNSQEGGVNYVRAAQHLNNTGGEDQLPDAFAQCLQLLTQRGQY